MLDDHNRISRFSRDLSPHGIGLMHPTNLPLDEVEIRIATGRGYYVKGAHDDHMVPTLRRLVLRQPRAFHVDPGRGR